MRYPINDVTQDIGLLQSLFSKTVGDVLRWADAEKRCSITPCYGPASMLAADVGKPEGGKFIYEGYTLVISTPVPILTLATSQGKMPRLVGDELRKLSIEIVNPKMTGETHRDRYVLTGDSPLASNNLGKIGAEASLEGVAKRS